MDRLAVFCTGAALYVLAEIFWRGRSHWTMALAGGLCMLLLRRILMKFPTGNMVLLCFAGAVVITAVEYVFGAVFNVALKMQVWDYSNKKYNICGQICPQYGALWVVLCAPAYKIIAFLEAIAV